MNISHYVVVVGVCVSTTAFADVVGREDFDGGQLNLINSFVPALDGGPGDYFGVGNRNEWPQGFPNPGVPFSIGDDSAFGYSNGGDPFPADTEGVYGMNSDFENHFFAISDSDEFGADQTANWTFNISGFTDLSMSMDMGGISNDSFGGYALGVGMTLMASIDGGPAQIVFDVRAVDGNGFTTRPMDLGTASGGGRLLQVLGDNTVVKLLAEDGKPALNTYLDKTPAAGRGAGELDMYLTNLNGSGSTLVLTLTADMPFEAMVFDNITIYGVPAPGAAFLLAIGGMVATRRRR